MSNRTWPPSEHIAAVEGEPWRMGSELRWSVRLRDGSRGLLAQLLPELRRDEAVRQRYVGDLTRAAEAQVDGVSAILDQSPERDPEPWRLRAAPQGEPLEAWLEARAPAAIDVVAGLGAALADTLHTLHQRGVVVRDLHPRAIVMTDTGPVLTDVGLARVDLLSTRTAASLVLEGTPYASPEQLRKTVVDQRSDLYGLGVILWTALTGTRPYGDDISILADPSSRPSLATLRPQIPDAMALLLERCVDHDPERRPESAALVAAVLRGEANVSVEAARVACQSCGATLLQGQRLCLECGKVAVVFVRTSPPGGEGHRVVLRKVSEEVETQAKLRSKLEPLVHEPLPQLNFIHGDARMYSKEERKRGITMPSLLFGSLEEGDARRLRDELDIPGVKVVVERDRRSSLPMVIIFSVIAVVVGALTAFTALPWFLLPAAVLLLGFIGGLVHTSLKKRGKKPALLQLRDGPAALPASDPLVARLAELCQGPLADDVRQRLGHLALTVQQLADHRATLPEVERKEVEMVTEPLASLVGLLEVEVRRVADLDTALADLDEGTLVRALASANATGSDPEALLDGLHRLRDLEQSRATAMHRLLEASALLRRAAELGLRVRDDAALQEREVQRALAVLGGV
ncbi:MAG: protein kinase [Nannocystaceae bacterium]|nr:protein kinase [Nannocystaceae bacterium]